MVWSRAAARGGASSAWRYRPPLQPALGHNAICIQRASAFDGVPLDLARRVAAGRGVALRGPRPVSRRRDCNQPWEDETPGLRGSEGSFQPDTPKKVLLDRWARRFCGDLYRSRRIPFRTCAPTHLITCFTVNFDLRGEVN